MKERSDKKNDLFGIDTETSVDRDGFGGDNDQLGSLLGNKPKVYDKQNNNGQAFTFDSRANQETSSLLGGANLLNGPMLDLTSVMLAKEKDTDGNMPVGESSMQLPRPYGTPSHNVSGPGMRLRHSNSTDLPTYSGSYSSYSPYSKNDQSTLPVYTPLDIQRMEEESGQSQMMQLIPDQSYLRERADAMSQVESNIVELGTIFNKLAVMVSEHQEMVQRVEDNVDSANDNINLSLAALSDTLTNLRTNKALFLKVFTVLVVFIILFISFFA
jgi:syntaxin 5